MHNRLRIIAYIFFSVLFILSCDHSRKNEEKLIDKSQENVVDSTKFAQLDFLEDFYDFGSIKQGEVVSYTFKLVNNGNSPLVIKDIIPECGCTKSKISSNVIKPSEQATIEVIFDSSSWRGMQYKSVTIRTNGRVKEKSVTIKANIVN